MAPSLPYKPHWTAMARSKRAWSSSKNPPLAVKLDIVQFRGDGFVLHPLPSGGNGNLSPGHFQLGRGHLGSPKGGGKAVGPPLPGADRRCHPSRQLPHRCRSSSGRCKRHCPQHPAMNHWERSRCRHWRLLLYGSAESKPRCFRRTPWKRRARCLCSPPTGIQL